MSDVVPTVVIDVSATDAALEAAAIASLELDCHVVVVGRYAEVQRRLVAMPHDAERLSVLDAPDVVPEDACLDDVDERWPTHAAHVGIAYVAAGMGDAFVTSGHARLATRSAESLLERLPGVRKGALAAVFPTLRSLARTNDPFALLLDMGANVDPVASDYVTNAHLGAAYAERVSGLAHPRVALLSNAGRPEALPTVAREADSLLRASNQPSWQYVGLIRADALLRGDVDVVLTDGYTGDIVVRTLEGLAESGEALLGRARQRLRWRLAFGMLGSGLSRIRELADWENYGGAPLLGYQRPVLFTQSNSSATAVLGSIKLAVKLERERIYDAIYAAVARVQS